MASFAGALTNVAAASLTRRSVSVALRHGMSSEQLGAIFSTQVYQAAAKRSALEGAGVLHAIIRMENQGWKLIDRNFSFNGGSAHGIDLAFERLDGDGLTRRYAVTEAKAGLDNWRGRIKLDDTKTLRGNAMQGSSDFNIDRLTKLLGQVDPSSDTAKYAKDILRAYRDGNAENFVSFARSDRLLKIDDFVRVRSDMTASGSYSALNWRGAKRI
jgi:hypothetical protein